MKAVATMMALVYLGPGKKAFQDHPKPEISAPTLIVSGALDFLTPAFQSRQMAARMPNAEHLALRRASHFALHERRDEVLRAMRDFLDTRARW